MQTEEAVTSELANHPHWKLVCRVIASTRFARSPRLTDFLFYITERSLSSRVDEISEQQIGIHVFGRKPGYDPGNDNIVRAQARLLRQRLEQYFAEEGRDEPVVIMVPRGSYVPVFEPRPAPVEATAETRPEPERRSGKWKWLLAGVGIALLLVAVATAMRPGPSKGRLWSRFSDPSRPTVIVPADSSLVLLQNLTERQVTLAEYANGAYVANLRSPYALSEGLLKNFAARQYTSMADVKLIERFRREFPNARMEVRFARFARIDDFKNSNMIVAGVKQANPWIELFEDLMNFRYEYGSGTHEYVVRNQKPLAGEQTEYRFSASDPRRRVFATVALLPNLSGRGSVLILQGTTMAGTEAAAEFAFQEDALGSALQRSGELPYFEIFLESATLANNAQESRVVSVRTVSPEVRSRSEAR